MSKSMAKIPKRRSLPEASIVSLDKLELKFGLRGRVSPYRELLERLLDAPRTCALKVSNLNARYSISKQARALGWKVLFAEHEGALYVKIDGVLEEQGRKAGSAVPNANAKLVLRALVPGPMTAMELARTIQADPASSEVALTTLANCGAVERDSGLGKQPIYRIAAKARGRA